jgi:hypothetical protein
MVQFNFVAATDALTNDNVIAGRKRQAPNHLVDFVNGLFIRPFVKKILCS